MLCIRNLPKIYENAHVFIYFQVAEYAVISHQYLYIKTHRERYIKKLIKIISILINTNPCITHMEGNKYVMIHITHNLGSDMDGIYFVQYTGNKKALEKFRTINTNGDVKYFSKKYSHKKVMSLLSFENLWNMGFADNVERLVLCGKMKTPGETRPYDQDELEAWWEEYLGDPKFPKWKNMFEQVITLDN